MNVAVGLTFVAIENATLCIEFTSDAQRVDELTQRIFAELAALKAEGPTAEAVAAEREVSLRQNEQAMRRNADRLHAVAASYQYEKSPGPASMLAVQGVYEALTAERLEELLDRHVSLTDYNRVTLLPEQ